MKRPLEQIWPSIVWTAIVFFLLSMDTSGIEGSGFLKIKGLDKIIHFVLFFAFSALWFLYFKSSTSISLNWLLLLVSATGSLYGLAMEFYQDFFTNRNFSYWDAVADAIGAAAGAAYAKKKPLWK